MKAIAITDVGKKRSMNQDYVFMSKEPVGNLPNLFIVADGMGGHKAGDFASRYAVAAMTESIGCSDETNPVKLLRSAIEQANREIIEKAGSSPEYEGMGTTLVAACIMHGYTYIANVGDSRLYVINREEIRQVTRDHSLVEEMVRMGEIPREEARFHPDKNVITRAIGAEYDVKIDFFGHKLRDNDKILLCSDGLTNMLEDEEIFDIVNRPEELSRRAGELINRANTYGGKDNISVILVEPFEEEVKACC